MRIRKNATALNPAEKDELVTAFKALKAKMITAPDGSNISAYDSFVAIHVGVTRKMRGGSPLGGSARNGGHSNAAFLSWHREFLRRVELELQDVSQNPDLSIPYWDWTDKSDTLSKIFHDSFLGGDGSGP